MKSGVNKKLKPDAKELEADFLEWVKDTKLRLEASEQLPNKDIEHLCDLANAGVIAIMKTAKQRERRDKKRTYLN